MLWKNIDYYYIAKNLKKFILDKNWRFMCLKYMNALDDMPDKEYIERYWEAHMGEKIDLDHPKTFNEKLQWLKLYDRKPIYTIMVDKIEAKKWVAEIIGKEYIIPTIGVWSDPDEIDFEKLPNQFVLKCNHNSGLGMCICRDKAKLDIEDVRKKLKEGLEQDYYLTAREWPYKDVERKILAEQLLYSQDELLDYKFMCFNGKHKCTFVCDGRDSESGLKVTFYDKKWEVMPFERHYPKQNKPCRKPENYEKMIQLSEKLAENTKFLRVDFYEVNGRVFWGECTFFPGAGIEEFTPYKWDEILGDWIKLI